MDSLPLKLPPMPYPSLLHRSPNFHLLFPLTIKPLGAKYKLVLNSIKPNSSSSFMGLSLSPSPSNPTPINTNKRQNIKNRREKRAITAAAAGEVDMVKNRDGVWTSKQKKVVVLWDLDNKPPRGPPYNAAMALKEIAQRFGHIVEISAYANRHAFIHLPQWVLEERRERRQLDFLERRSSGGISDSSPHICGVCGRKCRTNFDLKRHFKQLHERERNKKLARMRSLKGKKRQKYKERFVSGNHKYEETARELITPKVGYGLASELRRAGVFVKTVEDKPQAADSALKRQMLHSMTRGIDWLFLVSDDSDFSDMIRRARDFNLRTVVVGDEERALGRHADLWVSWISVENGEVGDEDILVSRRDDGFSGREDAFFSSRHFDEESEDDEYDDLVVGDMVVTSSGMSGIGISAFSEEEWVTENDFSWDNEEDGRGEEEGYF
ncbi:C2H2-like zinc finger protein [Tasmannia lanceolata]|uniref:C2H2-like zinc finger protein n=1 Tax=Tasmannia lanceolata TaxID=3420 RepID=UPI004062A890